MARLSKILLLIIPLIVGLSIFAVLTIGSHKEENNGILSGNVTLAGGPPTLVGPKVNYEVDVYATDGVTIIGKTLTDTNGYYSIQLPAGNYTIYAPDYPTKQTHRVTVFSNKNTILNLVYGTGYK